MVPVSQETDVRIQHNPEALLLVAIVHVWVHGGGAVCMLVQMRGWTRVTFG